MREFVPRGHFHSPLPDIAQASAFALKAASRQLREGIPGIDLHDEGQRSLLAQMKPLVAAFDWPERASGGRRFYTEQNWLSIPDAFVLYAVLRLIKPRGVIEIGSGFSSALMLDVAERHDPRIKLTFIDPHPERLLSLLRPTDQEKVTIHAQQAQDVPVATFKPLAANDILYVDSSHVSRAGSDLNHILFNVLPALAPGVVVHFHDVFWPFEYPADWIKMGIAWNEAYVLRAFLMFNDSFEILFWAPYAAVLPDRAHGDEFASLELHKGQSLWIRRII